VPASWTSYDTDEESDVTLITALLTPKDFGVKVMRTKHELPAVRTGRQFVAGEKMKF
jgi:hypothetical protein